MSNVRAGLSSYFMITSWLIVGTGPCTSHTDFQSSFLSPNNGPLDWTLPPPNLLRVSMHTQWATKVHSHHPRTRLTWYIIRLYGRCLFACSGLSVCNAPWPRKFILAFRIVRSSSYIKVIGSRSWSRSQEPKSCDFWMPIWSADLETLLPPANAACIV